jgi:hypothetical protein
MTTDTPCPVCGTTTPFGQPPATSVEAPAVINPVSRCQFVVKKWAQALFAILAGGLLLAGAAAMYREIRSKHPVLRKVTPADLVRLDKPEDLPGWITFVPGRSLDPGVKDVKLQSWKEMGKFLLLQVEDHWLLAKVDAHFNDTHVEGKLCRLDNVALPKVLAAFPLQAKGVLPFMLDAEYDIAATQRRSLYYAGAVAAFGVLAFGTGVRRGFAKPPPSLDATAPAPVGDVPPQREASCAPARVRLVTEEFIGYYPPRPASASRPRHSPRRRGWLVRAFFGVVWAAFFFVGAVVLASLWATTGAGDDPEVCKQLAEEVEGPLVLLVSLVLATLLGIPGWLPGTGR